MRKPKRFSDRFFVCRRKGLTYANSQSAYPQRAEKKTHESEGDCVAQVVQLKKE
ncbi:MAG TPA: hypothetical protein DCX25_03195 [Candidatus Pacebacteria bacterium]|nr:hypothetical protein [Candidatus Paceibacterota bacterium]HCR11027.1 hypothetical protein [Candidatus Paceibacterota bacterium]HCR92457.1 hypothetical protein [Candidatus Paceibacterota bacterium]